MISQMSKDASSANAKAQAMDQRSGKLIVNVLSPEYTLMSTLSQLKAAEQHAVTKEANKEIHKPLTTLVFSSGMHSLCVPFIFPGSALKQTDITFHLADLDFTTGHYCKT